MPALWLPLALTMAPGPINSFETPAEVAAAQARGTRVSVTREHVTDGRQALQIEFLPGEWPNVNFAAPSPWDWRGEGGLALDLTNPGREPVTFSVRVDDDPAADGNTHCRTGSGRIEPGATATFLFPLGPDPMSVGMRGLPAAPNMRSLGASGSGPFDAGHIVAFQLFMHRPASVTRLVLDNLRTVPPVALDGMVDRFGQYARAEWPGKLHAAEELKQRRDAEAAELNAHPSLPERDRFGGWAAGPKLPATGFFRTEKRNGKWWLVDPEGALFFSIGMDCVNTDLATFVTGRERFFSWLPPRNDPLARCYRRVEQVHSGPVRSGEAFDFFCANLERKYGPDYRPHWFDLALDRLRAWGFNTVGNWSDARLYRNGRVPYVATADIEGKHARLSSGSDYWGKMHDPFDPQFARDAAEAVRAVAARVKGDLFCLGTFVDNELSWGGGGEENGRYGLALGALAEGPASPARQAFLEQLRQKYGEPAKLNSAWGTNFSAWDQLRPPPGRLTAGAREDMAAFVKSLARRYFTVVRDALKAADPDHLYLGCRFAWRTPEAVEAAAEVCDVVSFNIYAPRLDAAAWRFTETLNKPCMIGEFHFGALDRGMFHTGLVAAGSQAERARMYTDYLHSVLDHPAFVGCHWFQYVDEPLTGRVWDGENYNIGFLTVTDTPYPEMVAAARQVDAEAYRRRAAGP
jgi:hypothetical protein